MDTIVDIVNDAICDMIATSLYSIPEEFNIALPDRAFFRFLMEVADPSEYSNTSHVLELSVEGRTYRVRVRSDVDPEPWALDVLGVYTIH